MATFSYPPFPYPTLTKINGKPKSDTVAQLLSEVYANAMAIPSDSGGGAHGHLGAVTTPIRYATLSGQPTAFVHPHQPAIPATAGLTAAQIVNANRTYQTDLRRWDTYHYVISSIQQQIIAAVDETYIVALKDQFVRYANRTPLELLSHLVDNYGTASAADLVKNRDKILEPWNPDLPFTDYWDKITRIREIASTSGDPISDGATVELARTALLRAGVYGHAITNWDSRPRAERTWTNFQDHFKNYEDARLLALETAQQAGYHSANLLYTPSGLPIDIKHIIDAARPPVPPAAPTPPVDQENIPPPLCYACNSTIDNKPKGTPVLYCWTHGLTRANSNHTSATCKRPAEGHKNNATLNRRQGGSTSIQLLTFDQTPSSRQS